MSSWSNRGDPLPARRRSLAGRRRPAPLAPKRTGSASLPLHGGKALPGCVLGFDWHSSGVTTTVCGAVKESLKETGAEWGLFAGVCDSLGRDPDTLVHASRTAAKVDNAAVQDGYQLYHHAREARKRCVRSLSPRS